jgi:transcriptional regulator GlxA family with amidase domain
MALRAIQLMQRRYAEPLSRKQLASAAHASPWHFSRAFAKATGLTASKCLSVIRIEAAQRLLLTTDRTVTDICSAVGYRSLGPFYDQFHRIAGTSPRRFRRRAVRASGTQSLVRSLLTK